MIAKHYLFMSATFQPTIIIYPADSFRYYISEHQNTREINIVLHSRHRSQIGKEKKKLPASITGSEAKPKRLEVFNRALIRLLVISEVRNYDSQRKQHGAIILKRGEDYVEGGDFV